MSNPTLKYGDGIGKLGFMHDDVKRMQGLLRGVGFTIDADGKFGRATEAAVLEYQGRWVNFDVDGIVGPKTWCLLLHDAAEAAEGRAPEVPTEPAPDTDLVNATIPNMNAKGRQIHTLVVHCSATYAHMDIGAKEIRQWHMNKGWSDIGYHWVIRRGGTIEAGRPLDLIGSHVKGHNTGTAGVCLVGGIPAELPKEQLYTPAQFAALRHLLDAMTFHLPGVQKICGHRDFPGVAKACPCFGVGPWLDSIGFKREG